MLLLCQRLVTEFRHRFAQSPGEPFGRHRTMTPVAGDAWPFVADHHRNAARGQIEQCGCNPTRIKRAEDFRPIEVIVFLDRGGLKPRARGQGLVDAIAS
jgi:hypothetical protein